MATKSVESVCNLLVKTKLLTADRLRAILPLWRQRPDHDAADAPQRFAKWLVARGDLTAYQAERIVRGHTERYFLQAYKLLDRLGQGRMAGVYKAEHESGQIVAIKVLPPSHARDARMMARFRREARLALRLKHPHVVRAFHVGHDQGLHFFVMEFLEGEPLDEILARRKKLPTAEAVGIVHQALLGLQHLHEQGVIHRDLKPSNLMLVGGSPVSTLTSVVKIVDVGLGKAIFDEGADPTQLTGDGTILGTPDYLAPEQARSAATADIRADIYSLGCVLFVALAGGVPYPDKNLMRRLVRHATEPVPKLRDFGAEVPTGLQEVMERMMAKEPADRFATPAEAATALRPYLQTSASSGIEPDARLRDYESWLQENSATLDVELLQEETAAPGAATAHPAFRWWPPTGRDFFFFGLGAMAASLLGGIFYLILRSGS